MASSQRRVVLAADFVLSVPAPQAHAQTATAGTPVAETHLAAETNASVTADGTVRGEVTPVGVEKAPFSRSFEGRTARNLLQR